MPGTLALIRLTTGIFSLAHIPNAFHVQGPYTFCKCKVTPCHTAVLFKLKSASSSSLIAMPDFIRSSLRKPHRNDHIFLFMEFGLRVLIKPAIKQVSYVVLIWFWGPVCDQLAGILTVCCRYYCAMSMSYLSQSIMRRKVCGRWSKTRTDTKKIYDACQVYL